MESGDSYAEQPLLHQLCQEPAEAPGKLSGTGTRTGLYSIELAI